MPRHTGQFRRQIALCNTVTDVSGTCSCIAGVGDQPMFSTIAFPNSLVLRSVAPSISRWKS